MAPFTERAAMTQGPQVSYLLPLTEYSRHFGKSAYFLFYRSLHEKIERNFHLDTQTRRALQE